MTDPYGNVVQLTDGEGKITKTYEYDSFGNEVKPEEKDDNPFRYCGEYYDKETGEVYLRARYYQPEKGRFLTRDTYTGEEDEPESLHLYAYCGNDGVNAWDPSGHGFLEFIGKIYMKLSGFKEPLNGYDLIAKYNYEENIKYEKKWKNKGAIYDQENQWPIRAMLYGDSIMKDTGCELIAVYNAIYLKKGKTISLSSLIRYSEDKAYSMRNGVWGTTPYKLGKILTHYGVHYSLCKKKKTVKLKKGKIYIISVYNEGGLLKGVHTFAVIGLGKKKGFEVYNDNLSRPRQHGHLKRKDSIRFLVFLDFSYFFVHSG